MASPETIGRGIIALHEAFPSREITERTTELWLQLFRDVSDADFTRAVEVVLSDPQRQFFPPPGVLFGIIRGPVRIDVPGIVKQIEGLGHYNPHTGWNWPSVETVRTRLGDAIADAYGLVGARLAASDDTGASIALRDFSESLQARVECEGAHVLKAPDPAKTLPGENASPTDTARRLASTLDAKRHYDR